jgi:hypothetical protein
MNTELRIKLILLLPLGYNSFIYTTAWCGVVCTHTQASPSTWYWPFGFCFEWSGASVWTGGSNFCYRDMCGQGWICGRRWGGMAGWRRCAEGWRWDTPFMTAASMRSDFDLYVKQVHVQWWRCASDLGLSTTTSGAKDDMVFLTLLPSAPSYALLTLICSW